MSFSQLCPVDHFGYWLHRSQFYLLADPYHHIKVEVCLVQVAKIYVTTDFQPFLRHSHTSCLIKSQRTYSKHQKRSDKEFDQKGHGGARERSDTFFAFEVEADLFSVEVLVKE